MSSSSPPAQLSSVPTPVPMKVASFDGTIIRFDLYDRPSPSLILIIPGFWRDRRHPAMVRLAAMLHGAGHRVAVVDVRGHGDSEGVYGFNRHEHYDVAAVSQELLRTLPIEGFSVIGLSYGGAIAISAAARDEIPIRSMVMISPVADFAMLAPKINLFTIHRHIALKQALNRPRFEWRRRRGSRLRAIDDIAAVKAPICFIHVRNDWLVGHTHSVALFEKANEPKELHILEVAGNYHADRIFTVANESIEPPMMEFLRRYR